MNDDQELAARTAPEAAQSPAPYPEDVEVLEQDGRRIVLVGTAHVSQDSVDLVKEVITRETPDAVCVELDERRFEALSQRKRWESLDLREVIRKRQLTTLLVNLLLASYQKRLGGRLGVVPGSELLAATTEAKARGIAVSLCDRDVRTTLRRAFASLPLGRKAMLISAVVASVGEAPQLSEEDLRRLRRKDALSELMQQLGQAMPELKRTLIDERDAYLATKIRRTPGNRLVAVVGAGHVAGMLEALRANRDADLEELDRIPEASKTSIRIGWATSALIVLAVSYIGMTRGVAEAGRNAMIWFLAHSIPSALGGILALGHPLTVLSAFLSAPLTALSPLIGVGYVTAFVQTYLVPPRVYEFETLGDDVSRARAWWSNRALRVFLVFILTTLGGVLGTWIAGAKIIANLLG